MTDEKEFAIRFLQSVDRIVHPFKGEEILLLIKLKKEDSLEDINNREKNLMRLRKLAIEHYNNSNFLDSYELMLKGFETILKQIADLKKQVEELHGTGTNIHFNSKEFGIGYGQILGALTHIIQKHQ